MQVGVAGASGYVGGELLRLLAEHPTFSPEVLTAERHAGELVARHAPHLAAAYGDATFAETAIESFASCELVFCALPHGHSSALVASLAAQGRLVVDLGADLRLRDPAAWATWYGTEPAPSALVEQAAYGLVERHRDEIAAARIVAVPGCYPTASILALGPLVDHGTVSREGIVVHAMSGASGAGRGLDDGLQFASLTGDARAYSMLTHRHTAEMEQELRAEVLFTPHLVPMDRGLAVTAVARRSVAASDADVSAVLHAAYDAEPFVVVVDEPPSPKAVRGSNVAHVMARCDERTGSLVALCAIDNLGKGAAGQAIQCANLMAGLGETAGLATVGVWP